MDKTSRREFLGSLAAASAFTIVPRRVLGGSGFVPPSDMILIAQVGCGTQAQRQVNTALIRRDDVQVVAFVDPNRDSQNYVDWEPFGNRTRIRRFLEEPSWGEGDAGIRAGRDVARQITELYYRKHQRPAAGQRAYEDYQEMLEKEPDVQAVVNITPDHQHGSINIAALRKGKAAISHKPVAERGARGPPRPARQSREHGGHAPARLQQHSGSAHARRLDRRRRHRHRARSAQLDQPSVLAAGVARLLPRRSARTGRLQLAAVARARTRSPLSSRLRVLPVSRLVRLRHRVSRRHGLLFALAAVPDIGAGHPRVRRSTAQQRRTGGRS